MLRLSAGAYGLDIESCIKEAYKNEEDYSLFNNQTTTCDRVNNTCFYYSITSEKRKEIIIVFRGTKTNEQLVEEGIDSLIGGNDFFGLGVVNYYFDKASNALWPSIVKLFQNEEYKDYKVYVTGHSLGGALAALCAAKIRVKNFRKSNEIFLYTFGQPRIGSSKFAFNFDKLVPNSWRVIHRMDIVPHLPPCAKSTNLSFFNLVKKFFRRISVPCDPNLENMPYHHGTEIWYPEGMGENDTFIECLGKPKNEDFNCSDKNIYRLVNFGMYIDDHNRYFNHKIPAFGKIGCQIGMKWLEEVLSNDPIDAK
uniref:Lipase_3 domain-containing protein n=1 Tax=Strongyloides papillosus TaxID=174720 RepID=A0A0N5C7C0_STREA